ncbi:AraC family transcriptional regulator [Mesorhizobium sp. B2-1-8]|uniref:AraC family transcriptional regulator n=1 Tax=Mesorhizobium sp. B2-1-8 TaxID=2589967 RepID=UPI00112AD6C9|nr:AraC family transcriptional regulator [Mesorhizobium sp. B2-1-8]UCI17892.1 AraC family transcriptional regulator [Mesorhizobium sp. B2-1-8]
MAHDGSAGGYYGPDVVGATQAITVPFVRSGAPGGGTAAVSLLRTTKPLAGDPKCLPQEAALVLTLALTPFKRDMTVFDRDRLRSHTVQAGHFSFCDLEDNLALHLRSSCEAVLFYISKASLEATAAELSHRSIDIQLRSGDIVHDPILAKMLSTFCPAFQAQDQVSPLFIDHLTHAVAAHFTHYYGGSALPPCHTGGGLTAWQEKRVIELLEESLDGAISLQMLANECTMSVRHFTRAFGNSFSMPPHRYILVKRVERAKALLAGSDIHLDDIAARSGFSNPSHLNRVFRQFVGTTPGNWRRGNTG